MNIEQSTCWVKNKFLYEFGLMKKDYPELCMSCQWLKYCLGGCIKDRIGNLNYLCDGYKMFFEHADTWLQRLAEDWKRQHSSTFKINPGIYCVVT